MPNDTVGVRFDGFLRNILLHYNDVDISIALRDQELKPSAETVELEIDTLKLYHKYGGDVTGLYLNCSTISDDDLIYVDDGDELTDELQKIFKFIDQLNRFCLEDRKSRREEE